MPKDEKPYGFIDHIHCGKCGHSMTGVIDEETKAGIISCTNLDCEREGVKYHSPRCPLVPVAEKSDG